MVYGMEQAYKKIETIAIALAGLPASLSHPSKNTREHAGQRLPYLARRMAEEIGDLFSADCDTAMFCSDMLQTYLHQLERGQYREAEKAARRILEYSRDPISPQDEESAWDNPE
jgi:hypothetical protein